jgi:spermidine synthase
VHSFVALNNPRYLEYGYEKIYAEVAQYRAATDKHLSVLMIGGGGYTFARYIDAVHPGSDMHVVEIDPGVTQFAYEMLNLARDANIVTFNEDARMFMARPPTKKYDLVLGDAFNHFSVPYHLTTKEFNDDVKKWMADDGLYVINIIDGPYGDFTRASIHTLRQTFKHVYVVQGNWNWREATRSFFVLIGTDAPIDPTTLAQYDAGDGDALWARLLASDEDIAKMLSEAPPVILTDQFAPVDQMLASAFTETVPKR